MKSLFLKEYFQVILYFILFNLSVLSATVILHELGHLYTGYLNGCKGRVILADLEMGSYTEINCSKEVSSEILSLGPLLLIIPFSVLFLALAIPEKYFFYVVIGHNMSISAMDMINIFRTEAAFYISIVAGIILILYGEVMLTHKWVFTVEGVLVKL